jgi:hypothetical protein
MSRPFASPVRLCLLLACFVMALALPACSSCDLQVHERGAPTFTSSPNSELAIRDAIEAEIAERMAKRLARFSALLENPGIQQGGREILVTALRLAEFSDELRISVEDSATPSPSPRSPAGSRFDQAEKELDRHIVVASDAMLMFLGSLDHNRVSKSPLRSESLDRRHLENVLNEVARRLNQVPVALKAENQILEPIRNLGGGYRGIPWGAAPSDVEQVLGQPIKRAPSSRTFRTGTSTITCNFGRFGLSSVEITFSPPANGIDRSNDEIRDAIIEKYGEPFSTIAHGFFASLYESAWLDGDTRIVFSTYDNRPRLFYASSGAYRTKDRNTIRDRIAAMDEAARKKASDKAADTASWKGEL